MHGLIHVILKSLVVEKFGQDKWDLILQELKVEDDKSILKTTIQYDDATSVAAVAATSKVLGVDLGTALRMFGSYLVDFVHMGGHLRMLASMGNSIEEFLKNVNHLHRNLERTMRKSNFPAFMVVPGKPGECTVSYASSRGALLTPLVEGILPQLSDRLYNQETTMTLLEKPLEGWLASWHVSSKASVGTTPAGANPGSQCLALGALCSTILNVLNSPLAPRHGTGCQVPLSSHTMPILISVNALSWAGGTPR